MDAKVPVNVAIVTVNDSLYAPLYVDRILMYLNNAPSVKISQQGFKFFRWRDMLA